MQMYCQGKCLFMICEKEGIKMQFLLGVFIGIFLMGICCAGKDDE